MKRAMKTFHQMLEKKQTTKTSENQKNNVYQQQQEPNKKNITFTYIYSNCNLWFIYIYFNMSVEFYFNEKVGDRGMAREGGFGFDCNSVF